MREERPIYDRLVDKNPNTTLRLLIVVALLTGLALGGFIAYRHYSGSDADNSRSGTQLAESPLKPAAPSDLPEKAENPVARPASGKHHAPALSVHSPFVKTTPGRSIAVLEPQTNTAPVPVAERTESKDASPKPDNPSVSVPAQVPAPVPQEPVIPPPTLPVPVMPEKPSYKGPMAGVANWIGKLGRDDTLTITAGTPSVGVLTGAGLPGVPVRLSIDQTNLGITEMPSAANGYRRLVLRSHGKHDRITIRWTVNP